VFEMMEVNLKPFIRNNLDVLFVGLNPPYQSNFNAHYFSGKQSRFFYLLYLSGLTTVNVDKSYADEKVFGDTLYNYNKSNFGVTDLMQHKVETNSSKVKATSNDVLKLCETVIKHSPKFICIIHSKVKYAFDRFPNQHIIGSLSYGNCGNVLNNCSSTFFLNYFPNGNNIPDEPKLKIFGELKSLL
jgi:G:T/U-mismatch repair DNA glycosylase